MTYPFTAFIGLGSNLGDSAGFIRSGIKEINQLVSETRVVNISSLYKNPPMGPQDQPDYINAVIEVKTALAPHVLLSHLMIIENRHGRERKERWRERTLDCDLLLYEELISTDPSCTLPHPGLLVRPFVFVPLLEIAPEVCLPDGRLVRAACLWAEAPTLTPLHRLEEKEEA